MLDAWAKATGASGKVQMLADGNAEYTKKLGLDLDLSGFGLGTRSKRFSAIVEDGVVKELNVEEAAGKVTLVGRRRDDLPALIPALSRQGATSLLRRADERAEQRREVVAFPVEVLGMPLDAHAEG